MKILAAAVRSSKESYLRKMELQSRLQLSLKQEILSSLRISMLQGRMMQGILTMCLSSLKRILLRLSMISSFSWQENLLMKASQDQEEAPHLRFLNFQR